MKTKLRNIIVCIRLGLVANLEVVLVYFLRLGRIENRSQDVISQSLIEFYKTVELISSNFINWIKKLNLTHKSWKIFIDKEFCRLSLECYCLVHIMWTQ